MKRVWPAAVITLLGCAPHLRTVSQPSATDRARGTARANNCIVSDTSAMTRDTLYAIGVEAQGDVAATTDCERHAMSASPVIITETPDPGADLRDVLDRGLPGAHLPRPDVVVTRDPSVLAYATSSANYFAVALPYDRTYVLVPADSAFTAPTQADRDALARDAVTADARGATPPLASITDGTCAAPLAARGTPTRPVVAYATGDAIARQLAERIVALAAAHARPAWLPARLASAGATPRVTAFAADSISAALATGRAVAAVVAFPRDPPARCGTPGVPLVDSRAHAIIRRGSGAAFVIGAHGSLRFARRSTR